MTLVAAAELHALRRRGAWYGVALALAVVTVVGVHRALAVVWPIALDTLGDTIWLAIVASQVPNLGQQLVWSIVMVPIYALDIPFFEQYKSASCTRTTRSAWCIP